MGGVVGGAEIERKEMGQTTARGTDAKGQRADRTQRGEMQLDNEREEHKETLGTSLESGWIVCFTEKKRS